MLLDRVWPDVTMTEDSLTQANSVIRRAIGDRTRSFIRTLPKRGYMIPASALDIAPGPPALNGGPRDRPKLAVLPFVNLSGDPEHEFFAEGLTKDLTSALALSRDLHVVPRVWAATYRGQDLSPQAVAASLGAQCLLEGLVRAAAGRLRVTTQLIDGATGKQVLRHRADGLSSDIFEFQDQITREVCIALAVELTFGETARAWDGQTKNIDAWERMVTARNHFLRFTEADNRRARELLLEALNIDPDYASAMIQLGTTYWIDARFYSSTDREKAMAQAEDLAGKVLKINSDNGAAWMLLGAVAYLRDRHDECLSHCIVACDLSPGDGWIRGFYATMCMLADQIVASLAAFAITSRLSAHPFAWVISNHALARMWAGDHAGAEQLATLYRSAEPDDPYGYTNLATILGYAGLMDRARPLVRELTQRFPEFTTANIRRSRHYRDRKKLELVVSILTEAGLPVGQDPQAAVSSAPGLP
jgi:adenylate cyclase